MPRVVDQSARDDWKWEGNVQARLVDFLVSEGWTGIRAPDTESQERGVDIEAHHGHRTLLVEVKGYPSRTYVSGPKAGRPKPTQPTLQARHWFSHAVMTAMQMRDRNPPAEVAIGLPDHDRYEGLVASTEDSLSTLGIGVAFVSSTGGGRWRIRPGPGRSTLLHSASERRSPRSGSSTRSATS
jgi:hypothetical protein